MKLFFVFLLFAAATLSFFPTSSADKLHIHIRSGVPIKPTPLQVHCKSKDDDIGLKILRKGEEFQWSFWMNAWDSTLFFCHFYWGNKDRRFDVFSNKKNIVDRFEHGTQPGTVIYEARRDGFYFSNTDGWFWEKIEDWNP